MGLSEIKLKLLYIATGLVVLGSVGWFSYAMYTAWGI